MLYFLHCKSIADFFPPIKENSTSNIHTQNTSFIEAKSNIYKALPVNTLFKRLVPLDTFLPLKFFDVWLEQSAYSFENHFCAKVS